MFLTNQNSIREVLLFPAMKPDTGAAQEGAKPKAAAAADAVPPPPAAGLDARIAALEAELAAAKLERSA